MIIKITINKQTNNLANKTKAIKQINKQIF